MVVGTTHQQQLASQSSTAPATTTEEEEFLKRNTDCVYFLASPLTCKKGSECEYRHSDIARVNPRDCWYWLNGNCLNPKCGFRHPPLDGLLGAEVPTPKGPSVPKGPITPAPHATPKQGVACIFFQKGFCLKGHLCPFLHGPPYQVSNKAPQSGPANPVTEPPKMAFAGPEKSNQEPKLTQKAIVQKLIEFLPPQGKQVPRMQAPPQARNGGGGGAIEKKVPPPSSKETPRYRSANVVPPPVRNEISASRSNRGVYQTNDTSLNGKDADEYSREPTPGFDVLVDNELGDSEYYRNEEQFRRSRGHEYDIGRSADYDVDRDMYGEQHDYDRYNEHDRLQGGQYAWEDLRPSSERTLAGTANLERKRYPRDDSPDQFEESDLRHRILKQRKGGNNSLRSVVNREHVRDSHIDRMPRRDSHHHHRLDQGSLSSRLRGRIMIPGRSTSPGNENDLRVEREIDLGRQHRSRYSPGRPPQTSSNHGRLRDRIKGRVSEDYNNERGDYRGSRGHRDAGSDNDTEFTGPKRLSELKGYDEQMNDVQFLGKRKYPRVENQQLEDDLSFEGPKPLSEILKRKRGGQTTAPDSRVSSVNNEDDNSKENNQKEREEPNPVSTEFGEAEKQTGVINAENEKLPSSLNHDANELEKEVGLIDEDAMLDQELEAYDHKDGDYDDYEQIDGEDYNMDEGEEYLDEEDGYEKKESDVYS